MSPKHRKRIRIPTSGITSSAVVVHPGTATVTASETGTGTGTGITTRSRSKVRLNKAEMTITRIIGSARTRRARATRSKSRSHLRGTPAIGIVVENDKNPAVTGVDNVTGEIRGRIRKTIARNKLASPAPVNQSLP